MQLTKRALVLGAGGFIGHHLVGYLKAQGYSITGADIKLPQFDSSTADQFVEIDLREQTQTWELLSQGWDEVYHLAADMGGGGYVFVGHNDSAILRNSASINVNVAEGCVRGAVPKLFFSSSACIYPEHNQLDPDNPNCEESSAYPANPDSEYGWEKLFAERLFSALQRNNNIQVRIGRYHNVYGPQGTWQGGREKAPAAICRKVAQAAAGSAVEIWGDGNQTRSFLYIDDCVHATYLLMQSDYSQPVNIGSEQMISINQLAQLIMHIGNKELTIQHISGPLGVRGRNSHNKLAQQVLNWSPSVSLETGILYTYLWINSQLTK